MLLQPVGRYMIAGSAFQKSGQRLPDKTRSKINKFCESFWKVGHVVNSNSVCGSRDASCCIWAGVPS